jgi:hypothetical protein
MPDPLPKLSVPAMPMVWLLVLEEPMRRAGDVAYAERAGGIARSGDAGEELELESSSESVGEGALSGRGVVMPEESSKAKKSSSSSLSVGKSNVGAVFGFDFFSEFSRA